MDQLIDLRSDTVTQPTPEMRQAMAQAPVGDDVFKEDPTVNRLEELAATMLGKEAALFVASGTMGNLISLLVHCPRGSEVILGDESHIYHYEQGGAAVVGSLVYHTVPTMPTGELPLDAIQGAIRNASNVHFAAPGVICLENTHNRCGGTVLAPNYCHEARKIADGAKIPMHLDGARLGNAAATLGLPLREVVAPFDSVQFDLSKGLAAPVGGVVAGSKAFIEKARRARKLLGGGMRQAGVIAAAGILSLEAMLPRLKDDHANAKRLAQGLAKFPQLQIDLETVQTNIVLVKVVKPLDPQRFVDGLKAQKVLAGSPRGDKVRFVTHYQISARDIEYVIQAVGKVLTTA